MTDAPLPSDLPLATVYIVNRNYGRFLRQAIESALSQTYRQLEILLIDDASDDDSHAVLAGFAQEPRLRIIRHDRARGLTACCNTAIQASRGEFLMRLDADDYLTSHAVASMAAALLTEPAAVLVSFGHVEVDVQGAVIRPARPRLDDRPGLRSDIPPHGACMMVRKSFLDFMGGYDASIPYQDGLDLWLYLEPSHRTLTLPEPLLCYRQHGSNLTRDSSALMRARTRIFAKHVARRNHARPRVLGVVRLSPGMGASAIALKILGGKPLIEWTLDEAMQCKGLDRLVVCSADDGVRRHVAGRYGAAVACHADAEEGYADVVQAEQAQGRDYDAVLILRVDAPFLSRDLMQQAIDAMLLNEAGEVLGVLREEASFQRHNGISLEPVQTDELYRVCPGLRLVRLPPAGIGDPDKEQLRSRVGHVLFDQASAFTLRTALDWDMAECIGPTLMKHTLGPLLPQVGECPGGHKERGEERLHAC